MRILRQNLLFLAILAFYLVFHLLNLTILPIFADEAIYIRWAQLILDEPARYLFFALNDGKTPLFIWAQLPFLKLFSDPLFAGRLVLVLTGFFQVIVMGQLTFLLTKSKKAEFISMLLTTILPFWFFHHRMALMDGVMTLFLTLTWYFIFKVKILPPKLLSQQQLLINLVAAGLSFGLSLWSKLPAILFAPPLLLTALYFPNQLKTDQEYLKKVIIDAFQIGIALVIGLAFFALLKISPAFGQLFARGSDFLFPVSTIIQGTWKETLPNSISYFNYLWQYLTWPVLTLTLIGLFLPKSRKLVHLFFWATLLFLLPISLLGKVVYPRYFLPVAIPLTLAASLVLSDLVENWVERTTNIKLKLLASMVVVTLVGGIVNQSSLFMIPALVQPNQTPFVSADQTQYLTEWSSGHGISETVAYILNASKDKRVAVATEGHFGTLPDAITDYLHHQDVSNLYVEGIGQPVRQIPASFIQRAQEFDQVILVVNSHRLEMPLTKEHRLARFCRPLNAPCLELWDISHLVVSPPAPPYTQIPE